MRILYFFILLSIYSIQTLAQVSDTTRLVKQERDSLYIVEVEAKKGVEKVLHAEPLFIDLIRDLGARKGEKEWNVGLGLTDNTQFDAYEALVEYEWAPINRLGLEVELPFTLYYPVNGEVSRDSIPKNKLNSLKLAAQWSFFVSSKLKTTLALGYLHEFEITPFENYGKERFFEGNVFNPFFIAAKRWGLNYHSLIYAGPVIEKRFDSSNAVAHMQINTNFHYMIPGTRNFIGLEVNKEVYKHDFDMILRPQLRVGITDNVLIGIVTGIPVKRENERFSSFFRLIYEPGH
jgi:hypothetical protein